MARPYTYTERATSTRICMGDSRASGGGADAAAPEAVVVAAPVAAA